MNQLLKAQADNLTNTFQAQIQALQDKISQQSQPAPRPERQKPPVPPKNWKQILDTYESANLFDDNQEYSFEEIMGKDYKQPARPNKILREFAIYNRAMAKARKAQDDRKVDKLTESFANIDLNDRYDPMDINLIDGA